MIHQLKQFVPSTVCLKCDGCCRFKDADSPWRPKAGQEDKKNLSVLITAPNTLDDAGYITTIQSCGHHFCRFLNADDNTCQAYGQRPFECALYPFILSRNDQGIRLYVHLSCPYVQISENTPGYTTYISYLKNFFARPDVLEFLKRNQGMFHDYTPFAPELLQLFDLPAL